MECNKVCNITSKYLSCYKTEVFCCFNSIFSKKNLCTSRITASRLTNNLTDSACTLNVFINFVKALDSRNINTLINISTSSSKNAYSIQTFILCTGKVKCCFSISSIRIHNCICKFSNAHADVTL